MSWGSGTTVSLRVKGALKVCRVYGGEHSEVWNLQVVQSFPEALGHYGWSSDNSVFTSCDEGLNLKVYHIRPDGKTDFAVLHPPFPKIKLPQVSVQWTLVSPKGNYVVVCYHLTDKCDHANVFVWSLDTTGPLILTLVQSQKLPGIEANAYLWRDDERYRCLLHRGRILFYEGHSFDDNPIYSMSTGCPDSSIHIAPERVSKDRILTFIVKPTSESPKSSGLLEAVIIDDSKRGKTLTQALDRVDGIDVLYSPSGRKILIMTSILVDQRGENYGSIGDVYLLDVRKDIIEAEALNLHMINEKMVQDAKWSPSNDEFIVIEGKSPSDIYLINSDGTKKQKILRGYRNAIKWAPKGDMVAIGGFGNLAGDITFFHLAENVRKIVEWRESCTVKCDWSPCGRYFFTASLWPRLRVDNGMKVWDRSGNLLIAVNENELYDVTWTPYHQELFSVLPKPEPNECAKPNQIFKRRIEQSSKMTLLQKYMNGEIKVEDLPKELRQKVKSNRPAQQTARHTKKPAGHLNHWRADAPSESTSDGISTKAKAKTKSERKPCRRKEEKSSSSPATPSCEEQTPEVDPPNEQNIITLLQQVLPANATVHVESEATHKRDTFSSMQSYPVYKETDVYSSQPVFTEYPSKDQSAIQCPSDSYAAVQPPHLTPPIQYTHAAPRNVRWLYVDPGGRIQVKCCLRIFQGPFSRKQMKVWWDRGYFPSTLRVRRETDYVFRPLTEHFSKLELVFAED